MNTRLLIRRKRQSGMALLVAIVTMTIMTVLITEITYVSNMRLITAGNQRDRVQAYWLAKSGVGIYNLVLAANKELGNNSMIQQFGLGDSLWQMVPVLNTGLMRMLFASEAPGSDVSDEALESFKKDQVVADEIVEASREGSIFAKKNFLDFEGDFTAEIQDTESKIDLNQLSKDLGAASTVQDSVIAQRLYSLMSGEENDQWFLERNLDRWELIGNIKDWVDSDSLRSAGLGGYEDALYVNREPSYMTKNAKLRHS